MNLRHMLLLLCVPISSAYADRVLLHNGDKLSGEVIRMEAGKLRMKTSWGGKITLPWSSVAQIELNSPAYVVTQDGGFNGTIEPNDRGEMQAAADRIKIDALQGKQIQDILAINPARRINPDAFKYSGRIETGLGWTRGYYETDSYYFSGQTKWENRLNRITIQGDTRNVSSAGATITDRSRIASKYDRFLNTRSYLYMQGIAEQDRFANILLRGTAGLGAGYQLYRREYLNFGVESGVSAVETRYTNATSNTESTLRIAVDYEQYFLRKAFKVENSSEAFLPLHGIDDLRVHSKSSLLIPLGSTMTAGLTFIADWGRKPPSGKRPLNRSAQATVGYGF